MTIPNIEDYAKEVRFRKMGEHSVYAFVFKHSKLIRAAKIEHSEMNVEIYFYLQLEYGLKLYQEFIDAEDTIIL